MYSDSPVVRELVALLAAHGIRHAVVCAGSRNAPLAHTLAVCPALSCLPAVDERSAAFEALGMAQAMRQPVTVCVTSGSALLDAAPAIVEAYYQEVPLVLISADRPSAWIDQRDGQTMRQPEVMSQYTRCHVNLPENNDLWHVNRLINQALNAARAPVPGPVHINVPLADRLFSSTVPDLPRPRVIAREESRGFALSASAIEELAETKRVLLVCGQALRDEVLAGQIARCQELGCVIAAEHLANLAGTARVTLADLILAAADEALRNALAPQLVITVGGHIVSKRLKQWLRAVPGLRHWHAGLDETVPDVFQHMTRLMAASDQDFLAAFLKALEKSPGQAERAAFANRWTDAQRTLREQVDSPLLEECAGYSDLLVMGRFLKRLPAGCDVHLANSSPVRNAQYFALPGDTRVFCNRGVNGIDGSVSAALGNARAGSRPVFCLTGDLSFFYDSNALWRESLPRNLRLLVFNNGGGNIFRALPGLDSPYRDRFIAGYNACAAEDRARGAGLGYQAVRSLEEVDSGLEALFKADAPMLLEVFTDADVSARAGTSLAKALRLKS